MTKSKKNVCDFGGDIYNISEDKAEMIAGYLAGNDNPDSEDSWDCTFNGEEYAIDNALEPEVSAVLKANSDSYELAEGEEDEEDEEEEAEDGED